MYYHPYQAYRNVPYGDQRFFGFPFIAGLAGGLLGGLAVGGFGGGFGRPGCCPPFPTPYPAPYPLPTPYPYPYPLPTPIGGGGYPGGFGAQAPTAGYNPYQTYTPR
ncbi:hypothetical protein [Bacillus sp. CGMCC 1.16541]|uniref:hypothetical protein n=1 Tax=Bacillus sp. CGMCC 1.16541 TaxID=2185143 RepID=UPI000D7351ED|nr:hypothetical protein [Bacillus sp. CGMCC 1.16541]